MLLTRYPDLIRHLPCMAPGSRPNSERSPHSDVTERFRTDGTGRSPRRLNYLPTYSQGLDFWARGVSGVCMPVHSGESDPLGSDTPGNHTSQVKLSTLG